MSHLLLCWRLRRSPSLVLSLDWTLFCIRVESFWFPARHRAKTLAYLAALDPQVRATYVRMFEVLSRGRK